MIVFPAIDLLDGKCVRLTEGRPETAVVYSDDPVAVAERWRQAGTMWLHVVDLDAAFGRGNNRSTVAQICSRVELNVQVGGGLRDTEAVREVLEAGAARAVVGTRAVLEPEWIAELVAEFGEDAVAGALDVRGGVVATKGWQEASAVGPVELAQKWASKGLRHVIYTDVSRDGRLTGPDVDGTVRLARETGVGVVVSGGVGSESDLEAIFLAAEWLEGVIIGKALYEGTVDLPRVLKRTPRR